MVAENSPLLIQTANWADHRSALADIRRRVFIEEQQVPEALEWDGEDAHARHWLALLDGRALGTVRMLSDGHIGRMAVLQEARRTGLGSRLLHVAIDAARAQGLHEVYLHAQVQALGFYAQHGFVAAGELFMDAGIAHRAMTLRLAPRPSPAASQDGRQG